MDGSDFNWTVVADRGQFDSGARFAPFAHFRSGYRWRREDRHGPNVCPFTSGGWPQPSERAGSSSPDRLEGDNDLPLDREAGDGAFWPQCRQRPRSHEVEDLSRNRLRDAFNGVGWTVEDLREDYGEDLLVRIFDNGIATPLSFVQAKGTDVIRNCVSGTGPIFVPLKRGHVNHWIEFSEPVFVALWDSKADPIYWNSVQTYFSTEEEKTALADTTDSLRIPVDRPLDATGLLCSAGILAGSGGSTRSRSRDLNAPKTNDRESKSSSTSLPNISH
jgi:hypothetical protein